MTDKTFDDGAWINECNPGIQWVVAYLNWVGIETCDSGDGVTHDFGCDRDYPYVCATFDDVDDGVEAATILKKELEAYGIETGLVGHQTKVWFQVSVDIVSKVAILDIGNLTDEKLVALDIEDPHYWDTSQLDCFWSEPYPKNT